jgi:hypothetical protein
LFVRKSDLHIKTGGSKDRIEAIQHRLADRFLHQARRAEQVVIEILLHHGGVRRGEADRLGPDRGADIGERLPAAAAGQFEPAYILHQRDIIGVDRDRQVALRRRPVGRRGLRGGDHGYQHQARGKCAHQCLLDR